MGLADDVESQSRPPAPTAVRMLQLLGRKCFARSRKTISAARAAADDRECDHEREVDHERDYEHDHDNDYDVVTGERGRERRTRWKLQ